MLKVELNNVYYHQNKDVKEYIDVFLETNKGTLKVNITSLDIVIIDGFYGINRLKDLDLMKEKYGKLYIDEVRKTYDNDMYLLISGQWILAIEYVLNSTAEHSFQDFRFIDDIHTINRSEFDFFKGLDIVKLFT